MAHVVMTTANGEPHGLVETYTNNNLFDDFKHMDPKNAEICRKDKKEDSRLVKIKYINARGSQERLPAIYCKYAGDPIQKWTLIPGYVYEMPMGLVNQINNSKQIKRAGLMTVDGKDVKKDGSPLDRDMEADPLHMIVPANF